MPATWYEMPEQVPPLSQHCQPLASLKVARDGSLKKTPH
jgi:hypothetical protein